MKVVLTGASGFIGARVLQVVRSSEQFDVECITRPELSSVRHGHEINSSDFAGLCNKLTGCETIVHIAGLAHNKGEGNKDCLCGFREVNVEYTIQLAKLAADKSVNRFVFISSIGVNGITSVLPFTEEDDPKPVDDYAQSKWEAEQGLWHIHNETGLEIVIIRPPLVYGAGAPGSFNSLVSLIAKRAPLPFGAIHNKRTLVSLDNLVDLICLCAWHPGAKNQVFLAGDAQDLSTRELVVEVASAMGKQPLLVSIPSGLLSFCALALGKKELAQRVLGSLQVDISKARKLLSWEPPLTIQEGFKRCFNSEEKL